MRVILKMTVRKEISKEDKEFYEELFSDGDISGLYENLEPEFNGEHELFFDN